MVLGGLATLLMCDGNDVLRTDGTWVVMPLSPTWQTEMWAIGHTLKTNTYVILLFPMFACSNYFYTYQFNGFNEAHFNLRTRAVNNILYWTAQILGACWFGYTIDTDKLRRSVKAKASWLMLLFLTMAVWGCGYFWQRSVPDRKDANSLPFPVMDYKSRGYWKGIVLYMAYGFFDAVWQASVYW